MIASGVSIGISEQALLAIIAGLTFIVGCFVGAQFKENQLSYRLNYLRAELDAIKAKLNKEAV